MQNPNSPLIDQQTVDRWQADGVVLLKGVFTPWIESLSRGVAALMANPSEYGHARTVIPEGRLGAVFSGLLQLATNPEFRDLFFQSPAAEIAAALMGSQTAKFSTSTRW